MYMSYVLRLLFSQRLEFLDGIKLRKYAGKIALHDYVKNQGSIF